MRPVAIFHPPAPPAAAILAKAPAFSAGIFGFLGLNLKNPSTMKMYVQLTTLRAYSLSAAEKKKTLAGGGSGGDGQGGGEGPPIIPPPSTASYLPDEKLLLII